MKIDSLYALCNRQTDMRKVDTIISAMRCGKMNQNNFFDFAHNHLIYKGSSQSTINSWDDLLTKLYTLIYKTEPLKK